MEDKYIKDFFDKHRQKMPDNGFSDLVIHHLPVKQHTPFLVWIFAGIGFFIVLFSCSFVPLINLMADFLRNARSMMLPLIISSVSIFILLVIFIVSEYLGTGYSRKKNIRHFIPFVSLF